MTQSTELADIGLIGLGVMGINLAKNFAEKGFSVIGHDSSPSHAMNEPAIYVHSQLKDFVRKLAKPRKILFLLLINCINSSIFKILNLNCIFQIIFI